MDSTTNYLECVGKFDVCDCLSFLSLKLRRHAGLLWEIGWKSTGIAMLDLVCISDFVCMSSIQWMEAWRDDNRKEMECKCVE